MIIKNIAIPALLTALNALADVVLPMKTAIKVRTIYKAIAGQYEILKEVQTALFDTHGEKDAAGTLIKSVNAAGEETVKIAEDQRETFTARFKELLETETTVEHTLTEAELGDSAIHPKVLIGLGDLLV